MRSMLSVEDMCKKLRPVLGEKVDRLFLAWRMADKPDKRIRIEQAMNALYVKYIERNMLDSSILLEPPTPEQVSGEYNIGNVVYAGNELHPFGLRPKDFPRHVCITGMSGSGKTNLGFHILKTFIDQDQPFMVLDWKKSFRQLQNLDKDILIFTVGNETVANLFQTNINAPPPGVGPKEWINIIADLVNEAFNASQGVHKFVSETLDEAFKAYGVYKGRKRYPTWHEIKKRLDRKQDQYGQGREREWLTSALRIAHSLTFGGFSDAVNSIDKSNISIRDLLERKVVFELHSLGASEKKFFCEYLLTYIYKMKKADLGELTKDFKHAIVVDEAHNIFLKEKTFFLKESITEAIYREIREYGVGLICMDQHISKLSDVVPGNSACNIAFQQMLPQDIQTSAGVMQLFEKKEYFSMLPVGTGIVRLAERYHQPFLVHIPLVELGAPVNDQDVYTVMSGKVRMMTLSKVIEQCRYDSDEYEEAIEVQSSAVSVQQDTISPGASRIVDGGERGISKRGTFDEPDFEDAQQDEITQADQRVDMLRQKIDRRFEKEKMKALNKLNERKEKEYERLKEKELRKVATIVSDKEEKHTPRNKVYEAVEVVHGPKKMLSDETLGRPKREGFNPHPEDYPHLGNVSRKDDLKISHSLNNQQYKFARAVGDYPNATVTELYRRLGLSARKGNQIKDELIELGVVEMRVERSARGWRKHLMLSDA